MKKSQKTTLLFALSLSSSAFATVTPEAYGASMNLAAGIVCAVAVGAAVFAIRKLRKKEEAVQAVVLSPLKRQRNEKKLNKKSR